MLEFSNNSGYGKRQRGGNNGGHRQHNRDRGNDRGMRNNPRQSMGGNRDYNKFGGGGPSTSGFSHGGNNDQPRYQGAGVVSGMQQQQQSAQEPRSNGMMSRFSSGKYLPNGRPSRFSDNVELGGQSGQGQGQGNVPPRFNNQNQMRFPGQPQQQQQQQPQQPPPQQQQPQQPQFAPSNNFAMNFNPSQAPLPVNN